MLTGAVELYSNHGVLIIGSTGHSEVEWDGSPASADRRHVAVLTRGQVDHTRVSFWSEAMPMLGEVVFDGDLDLDEYRIRVGDVEGLGRWTQRIRQTGPQRVVVLVDDPGNASRIHVGLDIGPGAGLLPLPSTGGPALFSVLTAERNGLGLPNERSLALDGHDSPHSRLTAAISLLSPPDPNKPWQDRYEAGLIAEWLRWLTPHLGYTEASDLGERLQHLARAARGHGGHGDGISHESAEEIARTILDAVARLPRARP